MKKLLVSVLAIAGLVACTQETTLVQKGNAPMEFGGAFVENATRANAAVDPSTTTESITGFDVWGFMDQPSGKVFEGEDVTGETGNFTYVDTQYWLPGHDYYFAALAPMNSANWKLDTTGANTDGAGVVTFKNINGTEDLLYAAKMVSTKGIEVGETPGVVKLQFNHLLSKVKFSFTNGFDNDNAYIDVKNIRMVVPAKASIDLAQADWWSTNEWENYEGTTTLEFGDACAKTAMGVKQESAYERLTIPAGADQVYEIAFEAQLYFGDVAAWEKDVTLTATVNGVAFEMGKAYNFKTTIDASNISPDGVELQPIVFDVEKVNEWVEAGDVDFAPSVKVATAAELVEAINAGVDVTLTQDIDLDATRAAGDYAGLSVRTDVVIDGAGHSIKSAAIRAINIVGGNRQVTLKNLVVEGLGERAINIESEGNVVNIENVTASSTHYVVNLVGSAEENVVAISNCELTGLNVVNVWGTKSQVTVNDTKLVVYQDGTEDDAFAAIKICNQATYAKVTVNGGEIVAGGLNLGGAVEADDAEIIFNGTKGNCTIENNPFVINYGQYNYSFATLQEAYDYAKDGETIVLCQDVQIDAPLCVSKNIVFDLNGNNITVGTFTESNGTISAGNTDSYAFWVKNGGELTINGEGEISTAACAYSIAVWAQGGKVTINGGKFTNAGEGSDLIYASANGHVVINGGEFVACKKQAGVDGTLEAYSVLNLKGDNTGSSITCYGGRYFMFDPANNKSENPAVSFVAPGYKSVANGDYFEVVKE